MARVVSGDGACFEYLDIVLEMIVCYYDSIISLVLFCVNSLFLFSPFLALQATK